MVKRNSFLGFVFVVRVGNKLFGRGGIGLFRRLDLEKIEEGGHLLQMLLPLWNQL